MCLYTQYLLIFDIEYQTQEKCMHRKCVHDFVQVGMNKDNRIRRSQTNL